jgi:xeroderma pigmentosum group C-complementing protein
VIHKSRFPDPNQRGRMFEAAITNLVEWWSSTFFEVTLDGHIRNRTYDTVQSRLTARGLTEEDGNSPLQSEDIEDLLGVDGETIRSSKSLMKHALMQSGSRDTSAQLFTALCRGLGIPARLVVSLQSVPWQTNVGKPKPIYARKLKGKGKGKEKDNDADGEGGSSGEGLAGIDAPGSSSSSISSRNVKGKGRDIAFVGTDQRPDGKTVAPKSDKVKGKEEAKPVIRLRKAKSKGNVLGSLVGPTTSASSSRLGKLIL